MSVNAATRACQNLPDPASIKLQKDMYIRLLDDQAKTGSHAIQGNFKHQKDYLKSQVEQQKNQFLRQVELETRQQELTLDRQRNDQMMQLHQTVATQKAQIELQAMNLTLDYHQKAKAEEMQKLQYDMEQKQEDVQKMLNKEMEKYTSPALSFVGLSSGASTLTFSVERSQVYTIGKDGQLVPKDELSPSTTTTTGSPVKMQ